MEDFFYYIHIQHIERSPPNEGNDYHNCIFFVLKDSSKYAEQRANILKIICQSHFIAPFKKQEKWLSFTKKNNVTF